MENSQKLHTYIIILFSKYKRNTCNTQLSSRLLDDSFSTLKCVSWEFVVNKCLTYV